MYVVAEDPVSGTRVKLAGNVHLSATGQVTTTFENTPQVPFEDFNLHFFDGPRAALTTPSVCGADQADASIAPWSGSQAAQITSPPFQITAGPHGSPCPTQAPFRPSLAAGSATAQSGALTPFTTTITREDGEQSIRGVRLHMPAGLSALLTNVTLCPEQQANEGTCGPTSLIGETTVSVGVGSTPLTLSGGKVYLTGPYRAAPFGLAIVTPAKAGPYDLGEGACDCVLVRARVEVDPRTAELTITTDTSGPHQIPTILQGIPLQIKQIGVTINRPGFTFNPTNCSQLAVTGYFTGDLEPPALSTTPFQAVNCANLKFAPKLTARTSGHPSKRDGASLDVRVTYPKSLFGSQANIASVKVQLPKQLPSRLTTLQQACRADTFEADPTKCPAGSVVGHARALTPVLPVPLEGNAYFVSHGGEAFPSLIIVLRGYNVTVELVGATLIRHGITSTTFKTVPDVPVSSFEVTLPQGRFSALAAVGNLCKSKLTMPTLFTAQNGATLSQNTKIAIAGCVKHQHAKKRRSKK
jgi:hypothetical protein